MRSMRINVASLGLCGLLALQAGSVYAQGGAPADEPRVPSFQDAVGESSAPSAPATMPGAGASTVSGVPDFSGDPIPPAPGAQAAPLTPEEQRARTEEINSNYDATLDIYGAILDRQETDPAMLERRIESNKDLLERYQPKLTESEQELRALQVAYLNRVVALKRRLDQGELNEDEFRQELERDRSRYERRKARLADDVSFYRDETTEASKRLDTLGREHSRVVSFAEAQQAAQPEKQDPNEQAVEEVWQKLDDLSGFRVRFTMDGTSGFHRYDHLHEAQP